MSIIAKETTHYGKPRLNINKFRNIGTFKEQHLNRHFLSHAECSSAESQVIKIIISG
jgi:hypothetical protein